MPKLLWANLFCLLDRSSGASISAREQLRALAGQGFDVRVMGATVFDDESGARALGETWQRLREKVGKFVRVEEGAIAHELLVVNSTARGCVLAREEAAWFARYLDVLEEFRPDILYLYGGQPLDLLVADEARRRGVRVVFYLVNGNYNGTRWCRDIDLAITDTRATASLYASRVPVPVEALGTFVDPATVVALDHRRECLLFVNPSLAKGGALVARLAILMERQRPQVLFEIVESRGRWQEALDHAFDSHGEVSRPLDNVMLTAASVDMRPSYARARLLLAPSLWWESGSRVIIEALMNGIPALITDHGGSPEVQGGAGVQIRLAPELHQPPYDRLPSDASLQSLIDRILELYDDDATYAAMTRHAVDVALREHDLSANARKLAQRLRVLAGK